MIELVRVNKYYPVGNDRFYALKDIDLVVNSGEMLAIQGKSGSGKTTLLNIMGCLDSLNSGEYRLKNQSIEKLKDASLAGIRNKEIGFVLQDFSLVNGKSVLFNTMLPLFFNKTPYRNMKKMAIEALKSVGIGEQSEKRVNQLSGGQKQRVAIARAIVNNPSLILADEPTGALDSETSKLVMELLTSLNQQGKTIVIVTHDDYVAGFCSRKVLLKDGEIHNSGFLLPGLF